MQSPTGRVIPLVSSRQGGNEGSSSMGPDRRRFNFRLPPSPQIQIHPSALFCGSAPTVINPNSYHSVWSRCDHGFSVRRVSSGVRNHLRLICSFVGGSYTSPFTHIAPRNTFNGASSRHGCHNAISISALSRHFRCLPLVVPLL